MKRFKKQSGVIVEVNEASYSAALDLGWVEVKDTPDNLTPEKQEVTEFFQKPRGRPRKEA